MATPVDEEAIVARFFEHLDDVDAAHTELRRILGINEDEEQWEDPPPPTATARRHYAADKLATPGEATRYRAI